MSYDDLSWQDRAACRDYFTSEPDAASARAKKDPWFPEKGDSLKPARAFCRVCPVRQECLDYAIDIDENFGIWAGEVRRGRDLQKRMRQLFGDSEAVA